MSKYHYRYAFAITLKLAFPNASAPRDFNEGNVANQIREAEEMFNIRFKGRKELSIYNIEDQEIEIYLATSYVPTNVTREVSVFSQILVKDFNFDQYSAKQGRLFNSHATSLPDNQRWDEVTDEEVETAFREVKRQEEEETNNIAIEEYLAEEHERLKNTRPSKRKLNTFTEMTNEILGTDNIDRLETYIKQLEDLTTLAKAKMNIMIRSKNN